MHGALGELVQQSLQRFAQATLRETWWGKEHDGVNDMSSANLSSTVPLVARSMMRVRSE